MDLILLIFFNLLNLKTFASNQNSTSLTAVHRIKICLVGLIFLYNDIFSLFVMMIKTDI
jgi:hypothetical protein